MKAELYALTHRGNPGDLAFYAELCREAQSVLELGVGDGRMLRALAKSKCRLVGLEIDAELLALARRNLRSLPRAQRGRLRLLRGDMQDFALPQRFERVLLPYNALYCLPSQRAALSCFRAVRRALVPSGMFAFDVWNAEPFQRAALVPRREAEADKIMELYHAGRGWDVFEALQLRRARQRLLATYRYVPHDGGRAISIPIAQRYFTRSELDQLLKRAGFAVEARYGDFERRRYSMRSPQQIVIARAI